MIYSNRAAAHMSLGMYADAVGDCNQAVLRDPDFAKAYLRRARAYKVGNPSTVFVFRPLQCFICSDLCVACMMYN